MSPVNVNNLFVDVDEEYFRKENQSRSSQVYNSFVEKVPEEHGRLAPPYNVSGINGKCQTIVPASSAIDANVVFPSLGFDVSTGRLSLA